MTSSRDVAAARARLRVLAGFAALGVWWGAWGAVVPAIQRGAGVGDGALGSALLFVGVGALASMRLTGTALDRFGSVVLPLVLVLFAGTGLTPALARGAVWLALAMFAVGITSGAVDVAINTASARWEAEAGRPLMNLAHAMFSIGVVVASLAAGQLRRGGLGALAVLLGAGAMVLVLACVTAGGTTAAVGGADGARTEGPWWRLPRRLLVIGVLTALGYLVESSWQTWSAVHLERQVLASPAVSAAGPAMFAISAAAGRLAGQRLTRALSPQRLVRAGALLAAVGTLVAANGQSVPLILVGVAAAGLGTAVCAPTLLSIAAAGVPDRRRGAVIGSVTTLAYLGFAFAPAFVGLVARVTSLRIALAAVAVAAVVLARGSAAARAHDPASEA